METMASTHMRWCYGESSCMCVFLCVGLFCPCVRNTSLPSNDNLSTPTWFSFTCWPPQTQAHATPGQSLLPPAVHFMAASAGAHEWLHGPMVCRKPAWSKGLNGCPRGVTWNLMVRASEAEGHLHLHQFPNWFVSRDQSLPTAIRNGPVGVTWGSYEPLSPVKGLWCGICRKPSQRGSGKERAYMVQ